VRDKIGPGGAQLADLAPLCCLGQRPEPREAESPEAELLDGRLLPGRVPEDQVEAGPVAQEHLREGDRQMQRPERASGGARVCKVWMRSDRLLVEGGRKLRRADTGADDQIEQIACRLYLCLCFGLCCPRVFDLGGGCVR